MKVRPLADRVIVEAVEEEITSLIVLPDNAKERPQTAIVVALGTGKLDEDGNRVSFTVKNGDKVLISKYGGTEIKIDGKPYQLLREDDLLGILETTA